YGNEGYWPGTVKQIKRITSRMTSISLLSRGSLNSFNSKHGSYPIVGVPNKAKTNTYLSRIHL
ncbi:MAG: hypothetical protein NC548_37065, partial [Lachnospiraceae bacterium]|nr:hypothetical protein [Lachnospiraceae bacterium]